MGVEMLTVCVFSVSSYFHTFVHIEIDWRHHRGYLLLQSCIAWSKCFLEIGRSVGVELCIAWIFWVIASQVGAWARWMAIGFGIEFCQCFHGRYASQEWCQFAQPLSVYRGIETLNMTPPSLPIFLVLRGVSKAHFDYVIFGEKFLEGFNYSSLWLLLGDVVDY